MSIKSIVRASCCAAFLSLLNACGGGGVSEFDASDIESPIAGGIDDNGQVDSGNPGTDPVDLENLPQIDLGRIQYSDPNVLVFLRAEVEAAEGATISRQLWRQLEGPEVNLVAPTENVTTIVAPDVDSAQTLTFQFIAQDSEGRVNSATADLVVQPSPAFARVIGGTARESDASVRFTVRLGKVETFDVSVDYNTVDGTAIAGIDYEATAGSLVIDAGSREATIDVPLLSADSDAESESFSLQATILDNEEPVSANAGVVLIEDSTGAQDQAPLLIIDDAIMLSVDTAVDDFALSNAGGFALTRCASLPALPQGLQLELSANTDTCVLSGTPVNPQEETPYVITAANAVGSSSATLRLTITRDLAAPMLATIEPLALVVNEAQNAVEIRNIGGGSLTSCDISPALPEGLEIALTSLEGEEPACYLQGTPTVISIDTLYTVTATNAAGSGTTSLSLSVVDGIAAPDLVAPGEPLTATLNEVFNISFINRGGDVSTCTIAPELPSGLVVSVEPESGSCAISGTPSALASATDYTITATNTAGSDDLSLNLSVVPDVAAPELTLDESELLLTVASPIAVTFVNNGGGDLTGCTTEPALPADLVFSVTAEGDTCELTGTPQAVQTSTDIRFTARNIAGASDVSLPITVAAALAAPDLQAPGGPIELPVDQVWSGLTLANNGGGALSACVLVGESSLPTGIVLARSADNRSCALTGTPTVTGISAVTVRAQNAAGTSEVGVNFSILPAPPLLVDLSDQDYVLGNAITPLLFTNTGGQALSNCFATPALPPGLTVAVTATNDTCTITGTPTAAGAARNYSIRAENAGGSGSALVSISVLGPPVLENLTSLTFDEDQMITPIVFGNTGGESITSCFADDETTLPEGLSVAPTADAQSCRISGTPENPGTRNVVITAQNAAGRSSDSIEIVIRPAAPDLANLPAQRFDEDVAIVPLSFTNSGGGVLDACGSTPTLPAGISVNPSGDGQTCVISGTPSVAATLETYTIRAINAGGVGTATVAIEVEAALTPPQLGSVGPVEYLVDEPIAALVVQTTPSTPVSECTTLQALPAGLNIGVSLSGDACEITGTPSEAAADQDITVRASNAAGADELAVNITVRDLSESVVFSLTGDSDVCSIGFATSEGVAAIDWNDSANTPPVAIIDNRDVGLINAAQAGAFEYIYPPGGAPDSIRVSFSRGLSTITAIADNGCSYNLETIDLMGMDNLEVLKLVSDGGGLQGEILELAENHPNMRDLEVVRGPRGSTAPSSGVITGTLADLPPNLERFRASGSFVSTGSSINEVPDSLQELNLDSTFNRTIAGSIDDPALLGALTSIRITGSTSVSGDLSNLRSDMRRFVVFSRNITGDITTIDNSGSLELGLTSPNIEPIAISLIPGFITGIEILGTTEVTGDISEIHPDMRRFSISANGAITGDIATINNNGTLELGVSRNNTISVSLDQIPPSVTSLALSGDGTIEGDVANIPSTVRSLSIDGNNTITGDIGNIPQSIVTLTLRGNNTVFGNIENIHTGLEYIEITGANTITGDIGQMSANSLRSLVIGGQNRLQDFASNPRWRPRDLDRLSIFGGGTDGGGGAIGYGEAQMDSILAHLNSVLFARSPNEFFGVVDLRRLGDSPPSPGASTDILELEDKRFNVLLNVLD